MSSNVIDYHSEIERLEKVIAFQQRALETVYNLSATASSHTFKALVTNTLELIMPLVDAKNAVLWTLSPDKLVKCWVYTKCDRSNCPAYNNVDHRCWSMSGTKCMNCKEIYPQTFEKKLEGCMECPVLGKAVLSVESCQGMEHEINEQEVTIGDAICKGLLLHDPSIAVFHSFPENGGNVECYQQITWLDHENNGEPRMVKGAQCVTEHDCTVPKTKIGLGLVTPKQIIGVICLGLDSIHYLSRNEVLLLTNLANIVAITIENSQLYSLMEKENCKMNTLCKEAHHRIKNNLQSLTGLFLLQLDPCDNPVMRGILTDNIMRVRSIAFVHQLLSQDDSSSVDIIKLADKIMETALQLSNVSKKLFNFSIHGDAAFVDPKTATNIAIVINELTTNSLKHGFRDRLLGRIGFKVKKAPNNYMVMEFTDNGNGFPPGFDINQNSNLGLRIAADIIKEDLNGTIQFFSNDGATVLITVKV